MPYIPAIRNYKPFYIQTASDATAWDTTTYGLVAQTQPSLGKHEVKDPYKNDWHDEHGDDEYVSTMYFKAFEFTVKFYVKTFASTNPAKSAKAVMNTQVKNFIDKVKSGEFKVWDSWQEVGYQKVRYVKDDYDDGLRWIENGYAYAIFSVTFKVNDPATVVAFSNNVISVSS